MFQIILSDEVEAWYSDLSESEAAQADRALDLLAEEGPSLRMPHSRRLDKGLYELRFRCGQVNQRVTYTIDGDVVTLTEFRKQRQNERQEVARARKALKRYQDAQRQKEK